MIGELELILGAAKMVPKVWNGIAGLFGKKAPKTVVEAGKLIDEVQTGIKEGSVSPEQQLELKKMLLENEQVKDQIELERLRLAYQDQAGGREVIKAEQASQDEYVRRTRPKILRRLFAFVCFYSVFAPAIYLDACYLGLKAAQLETLKSLLFQVGASLWFTFLTGFTGYTIVRSKFDKKGMPSDLGSLAGAAMGFVKQRL